MRATNWSSVWTVMGLIGWVAMLTLDPWTWWLFAAGPVLIAATDPRLQVDPFRHLQTAVIAAWVCAMAWYGVGHYGPALGLPFGVMVALALGLALKSPPSHASA